MEINKISVMSSKTNTPQIRFPEFSGEWEKKRLGEVAEVEKGKQLNKSELTDVGIYPCQNGGINPSGYTDKYNTEENTITISEGGNSCGYVNYIKSKFWCGGHCYALLNLKNNVILNFLFQSLKFNQNFLMRLRVGSGLPNIQKGDLVNFKIIIPSLPEQEKIASFLTAVDERIELLQKKKEKLEEYKKGVMQKLFSQEIRFKDENGNDFPEWEEKRLGEVGKTYNGLTGKTKIDFGEGEPYIQYLQIFTNSKINTKEFGLVNIGENENQSKVQYGDVFFTTSSETPNEIGTASVLLEEVNKVYLNSFCFGFRPNSLIELVPDFSRYLFRSEQFRRIIIKLAQGSTRFNMSKVELMKLKILLPKKEEQDKIASFLTSLDDKIDIISKEIEQSNLYKKGLLQKMFV